VPHVKTPEETKKIIRKKFTNKKVTVSEATVDALYSIYETYRHYVEGSTDKAGVFHPQKIGKENNEGYYTSLRDMEKIADIMVQDMRRGVPEKEALRYAVKRVYFLRLNNAADRKLVQEEILKDLDMSKVEYEWKLAGKDYIVRRGPAEIARVPVDLLQKKNSF